MNAFLNSRGSCNIRRWYHPDGYNPGLIIFSVFIIFSIKILHSFIVSADVAKVDRVRGRLHLMNII